MDMFGALGLLAGVGIGFVLSGTILKISDRVKSLLNTVLPGTSAAGAVKVSDAQWKSWAASAIGLMVGAIIAYWGYHRMSGGKSANAAVDHVICGIGVGIVLEEASVLMGA